MDNKINNLSNPTMFNGMRVVESTMAIVSSPMRAHKLTRSQLKHLEKHMFKGITYHDRIQKKWNKRFGFKQVPGCFIVDTSNLTFGNLNNGEKVILAHPTVVGALREHIDVPVKPDDSMGSAYNTLRELSKHRKHRDYETAMWVSIGYKYPLRGNTAEIVITDGIA